MTQSIYLEEQLYEMLRQRNYQITTAESLTGGEIAAAIINVPGASEVIKEAYITYSNDAKMRIAHVSEETISKHTEISAECASEMAEGIRVRAHADVAISATGIAGPDGGTEKSPVGLVYVGCSIHGRVVTRRLLLSGDRNEIRKLTVQNAIKLAISSILEEDHIQGKA